MSLNFNTSNININIKKKWINEYKDLNQNLKDEEFNLLKLFLVKNYHLNKSYKKYVYKEIVAYNSYNENNYKKIRNYFNDLLKLIIKDKVKNLNQIQIKKKNCQDLISSIKNESNKKYALFLKEEKEIENELKKFDKKAMEEYDKEIENWKNELNNNSNTNNSSILLDNLNDFDKEDISSLFNLIDKKAQKNIKCRTIDRLKNNKSDYNKKEKKVMSSKIQKSYLNKMKNIQNLLGNLNIKKNNENFVRLTSSHIHQKSKDFFDNNDEPLEKFFIFILKEIDNITYNFNISNSNINHSNTKEINRFSNKNNDEKYLINNIQVFINKMSEENKNINYLKTKIKYINNIIKDKMGGIYLGWEESEHNEFLKLKSSYKEKSNSFIFLTSLNNIFPYMNIIELKKHIKLYEIYLKINKIKKILIEKYEQYNKKLDFDKSRISKQTSTSVTKSTSSFKIKRFNTLNRNKMSIDLGGNSFKSFLYNSNTNFYNKNNNKKANKNNEYLKTNYYNNKYYNHYNYYNNSKEKYIEYKNYSSISLNNTKNKKKNYTYNIYKKGKIKNFFNKNESKKWD